MKNRIYVVSGNHNEFIAYRLAKNDLDKNNYIYVGKSDALRGIRDPKGVFYGSWRNRSDILEVLNQLRLNTTTDNPALDRVWAEVWKKANHQQINSMAVNNAAQQLADDIDKQVLAAAVGAPYNRYDYKIPATGDTRINSYLDVMEMFNGHKWMELK